MTSSLQARRAAGETSRFDGRIPGRQRNRAVSTAGGARLRECINSGRNIPELDERLIGARSSGGASTARQSVTPCSLTQVSSCDAVKHQVASELYRTPKRHHNSYRNSDSRYLRSRQRGSSYRESQ